MHQVLDRVRGLENEYPDEQLHLDLLDAATSMAARLEAAREVEAAEKKAVAMTIRKQREKYPTFADHHDMPWEKGVRDLALTLRVNVQSMLLGDIGVQNEKLLYWFRTIIASFAITPDFIGDTYTWLRDEVKGQVSEASWALIQPYLQGNIDVLADFEQPATPRV